MASKRWTWVTAVALLFAGLTNAHSHVHYCFDGRAPATSIYHVDAHEHEHDLSAAVSHHESHDEDGADHEDLDLDVPNEAVAKSLKHDLPAIVALPLWTTEIDEAPGAALAARLDLPPAPDPRYTHPLLRAPPR